MLRLLYWLTLERLNHVFAEITLFQPFQQFVHTFLLESIHNCSSSSLMDKEVIKNRVRHADSTGRITRSHFNAHALCKHADTLTHSHVHTWLRMRPASSTLTEND